MTENGVNEALEQAASRRYPHLTLCVEMSEQDRPARGAPAVHNLFPASGCSAQQQRDVDTSV